MNPIAKHTPNSNKVVNTRISFIAQRQFHWPILVVQVRFCQTNRGRWALSSGELLLALRPALCPPTATSCPEPELSLFIMIKDRSIGDAGTARHEACSQLNGAWQNWTSPSVGTMVDHSFSVLATTLCISLLFPAWMWLEVLRRKILSLGDFSSCLATST